MKAYACVYTSSERKEDNHHTIHITQSRNSIPYVFVIQFYTILTWHESFAFWLSSHENASRSPKEIENRFRSHRHWKYRIILIHSSSHLIHFFLRKQNQTKKKRFLFFIVPLFCSFFALKFKKEKKPWPITAKTNNKIRKLMIWF